MYLDLVMAFLWWPSFFFSWVLKNIGFGCCGADTGKSIECIRSPALPWALDILFSFAPFVKFHRMRTVCYCSSLCSSLSICDDLLLDFCSHCAPLVPRYSQVFPIHSWMLWWVIFYLQVPLKTACYHLAVHVFFLIFPLATTCICLN